MKKIITIVLIVMTLFAFCVPAYALEENGVQLVTNGDTTFIIESNGTVKGWGRNQYGEVGIGSTEDQNIPVQIQGLSNIREIVKSDSGLGRFFAIDHTGAVYAWGYNGYGQLGLGHFDGQYESARIEGLPPVSKIITDGYTTYALTTEGDAYAWGRNDYGQVGNGSLYNQSTPQQLNVSSVKDIVAKSSVAYAVTDSGDVYTWGRGDDFQLGLDDYTPKQTTPVQIPTLSNVDEIVTSGRVTFAICDNRQEVYSWGESAYGELGNYSERNREPNRVWTLSDLSDPIDELIMQSSTCFAITGDGTLYGWGYNSYNQLGNGSTFEKGVPTLIQDIPKVKDFEFTNMVGIALGVDNGVYTWGKNYYGEAGTGDQSRVRYPMKLAAVGNDIVDIVAANSTVYAIDSVGQAYGWGSNYRGQAGIGVKSAIAAPAAPSLIPDLNGVVGIENVDRSVYAMTDDGAICGWGDNGYYQSDSESREDVLQPNVISTNQMITAMGTGNVDSTVPVVGTIDALEISFTHPANISYTIDPNSADGFCCPDIAISNNSKVPVKVTIETFAASADRDLVFEDVLPDSVDWTGLNREGTKRYIALGLQYTDASQWLMSQSEMEEPVYAVEIDDTYIGALAKGCGAALRLCGRHGLAFDGSYTVRHELVFVVSLL